MALGSNQMSATNVARRTTPLAGLLPAHKAPGTAGNIVLDCTSGERFGLRGLGAAEWLSAQGVALPEKVNTVLTLPDGTSVLRLGQQDMLLTAPAGGNGSRVRELRAAWRASDMVAKGYDAYRDEGWAWFIVSGKDAALLMARLSMADFRAQALKVGQVAQTRALHQDAVIARLDRFGALSYDIFVDIASSQFVLDVLLATTAEIDADFRLEELRASDE
ncbi:hypothetical protein [Devosia ginsengisoli]|nr:hypothetical protein [Devosia ginsengisoli]